MEQTDTAGRIVTAAATTYARACRRTNHPVAPRQPRHGVFDPSWGPGRFAGLYGATVANEFEVAETPDGKIVDFLSGQALEARPEERVRQRYLRVLHYEYGYPKNVLAREVPIWYGNKPQVGSDGESIRADIAVYRSATAASVRDQGQIFLVVECKRPTEATGYSQLVSYVYNTSAEGCVWYNGTDIRYYRRESPPANALYESPGIPRYRESWASVGRLPKAKLIAPRDVKGLLRRCHNKLHGRGAESDEEDLAMDMVRILLAKAKDEELPGDLPDFYCTQEEYISPDGRAAVAKRVQQLFRRAADDNRDVFSEHERIQVGDRAICDVVVELQRYRLLADLSASAEWDLMGHAYEQYTAAHLKKQRGQFFTNRLIVDFMIDFLEPEYEDVVLDPAGGSGGFLTSALRRVRSSILHSPGTNASKERRLSVFRNHLFMVEVSRRLVKVAKTAMILNGDGHAGMTQGDSLGPYSDLDAAIREGCPRHRPTVVVTNPPFAGVGEGRIRDAATLRQFAVGRRWTEIDRDYRPTDELIPDGAPPELLFFERVLDWTAPGGRFGIVLPKSFLDTAIFRSARSLLFTKARLLAVVNCHKNTFQPYTGVRTCIIFGQKLQEGESVGTDYNIFMAISRRIGQDSEGVPIFKLDATGTPTEHIDHDLTEILADYKRFKEGVFEPSESRFCVRRSELDDQLRINPQAYLPHLNETIRQIEAIEQRHGWSVSALGQLDPNIAVFKGPRLKSENIIVESPEGGPNIEPYYTPSAVLQDKSDSVKWLDLDKASESQLRTIDAIRVRRGDIVITRSGSIGRISMVTRRLDGAIVSDDLIRVRVPDDDLRWYLFAFLQTRYAYNQMLRNEYGAVQQHLEPEHVREILVPIPEDFREIAQVIAAAKVQMGHKEASESFHRRTLELSDELMTDLIGTDPETSV